MGGDNSNGMASRGRNIAMEEPELGVVKFLLLAVSGEILGEGSIPRALLVARTDLSTANRPFLFCFGVTGPILGPDVL